jgi:hypothetical protein
MGCLFILPAQQNMPKSETKKKSIKKSTADASSVSKKLPKKPVRVPLEAEIIRVVRCGVGNDYKKKKDWNEKDGTAKLTRNGRAVVFGATQDLFDKVMEEACTMLEMSKKKTLDAKMIRLALCNVIKGDNDMADQAFAETSKYV